MQLWNFSKEVPAIPVKAPRAELQVWGAKTNKKPEISREQVQKLTPQIFLYIYIGYRFPLSLSTIWGNHLPVHFMLKFPTCISTIWRNHLPHLTSKWRGTFQYFQSHDKIPYTPVVNSKERTRIATPWSTWRCTLVLSTTVRKVCGLSCILMKFSTLIHVICYMYNIMPIPCVFVWGLRIDDLRIYVYSNLLKNWSLVNTIPYYYPQPILLADEID